MNKYYDYILTYLDDEDGIGQLANDIYEDDMFPVNERDPDKIREYFDHYIKNERMKKVALETVDSFEQGKWI